MVEVRKPHHEEECGRTGWIKRIYVAQKRPVVMLCSMYVLAFKRSFTNYIPIATVKYLTQLLLGPVIPGQMAPGQMP